MKKKFLIRLLLLSCTRSIQNEVFAQSESMQLLSVESSPVNTDVDASNVEEHSVLETETPIAQTVTALTETVHFHDNTQSSSMPDDPDTTAILTEYTDGTTATTTTIPFPSVNDAVHFEHDEENIVAKAENEDFIEQDTGVDATPQLQEHLDQSQDHSNHQQGIFPGNEQTHMLDSEVSFINEDKDGSTMPVLPQQQVSETEDYNVPGKETDTDASLDIDESEDHTLLDSVETPKLPSQHAFDAVNTVDVVDNDSRGQDQQMQDQSKSHDDILASQSARLQKQHRQHDSTDEDINMAKQFTLYHDSVLTTNDNDQEVIVTIASIASTPTTPHSDNIELGQQQLQQGQQSIFVAAESPYINSGFARHVPTQLAERLRPSFQKSNATNTSSSAQYSPYLQMTNQEYSDIPYFSNDRDSHHEDDVDDNSLLDLFGQVTKEYLTKKVIPPTDPKCRWNWKNFRCEPACQCSLSIQKGDYHLGRSCRYRNAYKDDTQNFSCDPSFLLHWHEKPVIRRFVSLMNQTTHLLHTKTKQAAIQAHKHGQTAQQFVCYQYFTSKLKQEKNSEEPQTISMIQAHTSLSEAIPSPCLPGKQISHKKSFSERFFCGADDFEMCQE